MLRSNQLFAYALLVTILGGVPFACGDGDDGGNSGGAAGATTTGGEAGRGGSAGSPEGGRGGSAGLDAGTGGDAGAETGGAGRGGSAGDAGAGTGGAGRGGSAGDAGAGTGGSPGDPCDGVTCSGHGACVVVREQARCDCDDGYARPNGDPETCADVDECETDNGGCDPLTLCTNTDGGRACGACPPGYAGDGVAGCVPEPCAGAPGNECPCIKVTPDGDDALAEASYGRTPFRSVQPAIDFADVHRTVAVNVCVAGGISCDVSTSYPGPAGADLTMRDGISVWGSYESSGWTRCSGRTTELSPDTSRGVYFDASVTTPTVLDGFGVRRRTHAVSAGVTVLGARGVLVSNVALSGAADAGELYGVDVAEGADATITGLTITSFESGMPVASTGHATALRSVGSRVTLSSSNITLFTNGTAAEGVRLEGSPDSRIESSNIRLANLSTTLALFTGVFITGDADGISIASSSLRVGTQGRPTGEQYGVDIDGEGAVSIVGGNIDSALSSSSNFGVRSIGARLLLDTALSVGPGYGVWLEDAPGSVIRGSVSVAGGGGIRVAGDAQGTEIHASVDVRFGEQSFGISLGDCDGASVLVSEGEVRANGVSAEGIRVGAGCGARIEANRRIEAISPRIPTAIRCDGSCSIVDNATIAIDGTRPELGPNTLATGIRCGAGCDEISGNTIAVLDPGFICHNSCLSEGYGIDLSNSNALVDRNVVRVGCADIVAGIRATNSTSRIQNNLVSGRTCSSTFAAGARESFGIAVSSGDVDVHSNTIDGGEPRWSLDTCRSGALAVSGGTYRNNILLAGGCQNAASVWEVWRPSVFENNHMDPSIGPLYRTSDGTVLHTPIEVNNLPGMVTSWNGAFEPQFVSSTDRHLSATSPAVNMGTSAEAPADDMDGQPRDAQPDVGADEWVAAGSY